MLRLTRLREADIYQVMEWRMRPDVTEHMYTDPVLTRESQLAWYQDISNRDDCIYWIIEFDGSKVGVLSIDEIDRDNRRCAWAYYVAGPTMRGKGIGRNLECNLYDYVFDVLQLNKLCCEVFSKNQRVVALHEKCGSKIEGVLRQHVFKNGEFHDVVRMAILRDEWFSIRGGMDYQRIEIE